ncbi:hypothetical protein QUF80_04805 [Desulfococcaceae bacterium HSG8]|nr:hypothetical protein [Desulfococcaceae bacterium HSG8]
MKKVFVFALCVGMFLMFTAPVTAMEIGFSGEYYVEGVLNSNENLDDDDATSQYRRMRLRFRTEVALTETLQLITRFDALEKVWSSNDSAFANEDDEENIDFDRAYMRIISPVGLIQVGRQEGVTWGTDWADDEADTDRIKYVLPVPVGGGKLYLAAVAEKVTENDAGTDFSDQDNDKYYIGAVYKAENYHFGLLSAFYNFREFQDPQQAFKTRDALVAKAALDGQSPSLMLAINANTYAAEQYSAGAAQAAAARDGFGQVIAGYGASTPLTTVAAAVPDLAGGCDTAAAAGFTTAGEAQAYFGQLAEGAATEAASAQTDATNAQASLTNLTVAAQTAGAELAALGTTCEAGVYLLAPYFSGKFGGFSFQAELDYIWGTIEFDAPGMEDKDAKACSYFAEGSFDAGPFTFQGGYAYVSGDSDYGDDEIGSMGYVAPGVDWGKMFILSRGDSSSYGRSHGMNTTLANGIGNHVGGGFATASTTMLDGYSMIYGGMDFAVTDKITLGFLAAMSKADDPPDGIDDDQGYEYDVKFEWKFTESLKYEAIGAFLDAGDYWMQRGNVPEGDFDDIYCLYHKLTLTF